jgi:hypothetical protein
VPRYQPPSWITRISADLAVHRAAGDSSSEALFLRAIAVRDHGPALFKLLVNHAREACWALRYKWFTGANWFTVQNTELPFRQLTAVLDQQELGICLNYTLGSLIGSRNPTETKDFVDVYPNPPENYLVMSYHGTLVKAAEVMEIVFREAFVPKVPKK